MGKGMKYLILGLLLFCGIFYGREAEAASVKIDKTNFPDAFLREEMKQRDFNSDGKLSDKEIKLIKTLKLRAEKNGKYWKLNLKGLSRLTSLKDLHMAALVLENRMELDQLKTLQKLYLYQSQDIGMFDLSRLENVTDISLVSESVGEIILRNNKKLKKLYLSFGSTQNMKELNLLEIPSIEEVELRVDSIGKIKLQGHSGVKKLNLMVAQREIRIEKMPKLVDLTFREEEVVKKLILQDCPSLETLQVDSCSSLQDIQFARVDKLKIVKILRSQNAIDNNTKKLDFSGLPGLRVAEIHSKKLEKLILPKSNQFVSLYIAPCRLKELDLSRVPKLNWLSLGWCNIKKLDLTKVPKLEILHLSYLEKVKKLDFSKLKKLEKLEISGLNQLKKLNLPKPKRLKELSIYGCKSLKKINFNKMTNLKSLDVYKNRKIKKLDIRKLKKLEYFVWQNGVLKKILWGKKKRLGLIDVSYNKLSGKLDLRKFSDLTKVWCDHNKLTSLYGGESLYNVHCYNNKLKKIDMRKAKDIWGLWCYNNSKKAKIYLYTKIGGDGGISKDSSAKIKYVKK